MNSSTIINSRTYKALHRADCLFSEMVKRLNKLVDPVLKGSAFASMTTSFSRVWSVITGDSVLARLFGPLAVMPFVPYGMKITATSAFGIILAGTVFLPTSVVFLLAVIFAPFILIYRDKKNEQLISWPELDMTVPLFILFLFLVGATFSSVLPKVSLSALIIWCFFGLFFLFGVDMGKRDQGERMVWPLLTATTMASFVGIAQHFVGGYTPQAWLDQQFEGEITRVVGTFDNPIFFAEMIGLILPVTIALMLKRKDIRDKLLLLVYSGVQGVGLLLTYTRGAWLGFLVSMTVLSIMYEKKMLIVVVIVAVAAFALAPPVITQRLLSSFNMSDSSNNYRMSIWRGSMTMIRAFLFRGVGLGAQCFSYVYPEYMIIQTPAPHSHSTLMQMLVEIGLFGFIALMIFLVTWAIRVLFTVFMEKGGWRERWIKIGLLSGIASAIAGNMVQGLIDHTWYSPRIGVVFWAWMGLGAGLLVAKKKVANGTGLTRRTDSEV